MKVTETLHMTLSYEFLDNCPDGPKHVGHVLKIVD
jgi:hypothetical protein